MQSFWVRCKVKLNNHLQWIEIHCRNMHLPDGTVAEYSKKGKIESQQKSNYFIEILVN